MNINQNTKLKADNDGSIQIQCFKTTIKQLTTSDGLGKLKHLKVGQTVIITTLSKRQVELKTKDGKTHTKWIFDLIDINGKPLGWIYAECVFPEMISMTTGNIKL